MKNLLKKKLLIHYTARILLNAEKYSFTISKKKTSVKLSGLYMFNSISVNNKQTLKKPITMTKTREKNLNMTNILIYYKNFYCINKKFMFFFNANNIFISILKLIFFTNFFLIQLNKTNYEF